VLVRYILGDDSRLKGKHNDCLYKHDQKEGPGPYSIRFVHLARTAQAPGSGPNCVAFSFPKSTAIWMV